MSDDNEHEVHLATLEACHETDAAMPRRDPGATDAEAVSWRSAAHIVGEELSGCGAVDYCAFTAEQWLAWVLPYARGEREQFTPDGLGRGDVLALVEEICSRDENEAREFPKKDGTSP